ncbi:MAG: hypothetical protein AAF587_05635 [Bacteroidota bacterium]
MEYLNPFTRLNLNLAEFSPEGHKESLKLEKKRLLAEFELHNTNTIELGGKMLDKATVLQLFDELEDAELANMHLRIHQLPSLMAFLEDSTLEYFFSGDVALLSSESSAFQKYIGPYFAEQYNKRLFHAFRQLDWEEVKMMCAHPLAIPTEFHAACYKDTYRDIHSKSREVSQVASKISEGQAPGAEIQEVCDEMLILTLNHLPEYFGGSRDKYGLALEELAVAVHNVHRRVKLGIFILRQGLKLNISQSTTARLTHILDQLKELAPAESFLESWTADNSGKNNNAKPWWFVVGGAAVVYLILKTLGIF